MTATPEITIQRKIPSRKDALIFRAKTALLQIKRGISNQIYTRMERHPKRSMLSNRPVVAISKTPLWTEKEPEERVLLAGKIHNLRLAIRELDGVEIPAGKVFSFWKHVGRTNRLRGFVVGRELREGCIIPNIGGGLCQISNALYDAALQANFKIVERHAHTQVIHGSLAEKGHDATVFWNYVDLRFKAEKPFRIEAKLDDHNLTVSFRGEKQQPESPHQLSRTAVHNGQPNSCATCETGDCHRVILTPSNPDFGTTAFLVDEFSPEFNDYIQTKRTSWDLLFIPLDGRRFKKANYAWTSAGFADFKQSFFVTVIRSYKSRRLATQGKTRQLNLLAMYEKLAGSYARRLKFDVLHIVVQQNLLPFLWKNGHLGGRSFDVLMTALPMNELQKRLDSAHLLHPESTTLADFRIDAELLRAETEALQKARKIITPHSEIASLFPNKAELLDWKIPEVSGSMHPKNDRPRLVFPAATVGRKGCYELREALKGLDVTLVLLGSTIEKEDFWHGFDIEKGGDDWGENVDLIVLPAFIEHKPRRLLYAAAMGIPVIASKACGLENVAGLEIVATGDAGQLREKILSVISVRRKNPK